MSVISTIFSDDASNNPATDQDEPASHYQDLKNELYKQPEPQLLNETDVTTVESFETEPTTIPPETGTTLTMDTTTSGPTTTTNH